MSESKPEVREASKLPAKRISAAWIIPIVAVLLGLWLVAQHISGQGPQITITFETAEGLQAGKTVVKCRSVAVGKVEDVKLSSDLKSVIATVRMNQSAVDLLREDTRFWVVRPRVGGGSVSGIDTIFSGAFIQLEPGSEERTLNEFTGLEDPPATPQDVPGLRFIIKAKSARSLGVGSPIFYNGYEVGQIEKSDFDQESLLMEHHGFVRAPYNELVTENVRFWNSSGINFDVDSKGFSFQAGSIESIISGGLAFGIPKDSSRGEPVSDGAVFELFDSFSEINKLTLQANLPYLLMFDDSVRGLLVDAPVEFRGIQVGKVVDISFEYLQEPEDRRVPVLIQIDPTRFGNFDVENAELARHEIDKAITQGLRASLRTGSLITGQLYVDLDFEEDADPVTSSKVGELSVIPTQGSSLSRIEDRVVQVLDKVRNLPVEKTLSTATDALAEIKQTAGAATDVANDLKKTSAALEALLTSPDVESLPAEFRLTLKEAQKSIQGVGPDSTLFTDLARTLEDLQATLQSVKVLADTIDNKPNSLIFGKEGAGKDPVPGRR